MRVILTGIGSRGDVFPYLGFGQALLRRGHSVAMITTANYEPYLKEAGIEFIELAGADFYEQMEANVQGGGGILVKRFASQGSRDFVANVLKLIPAKVVRLVKENAEPGQTIFAPGDLYNLGAGSLVEEAYGIPHVGLSVVPGWFWFTQPSISLVAPKYQGAFKSFALKAVWQARDAWQAYKAMRTELGLPQRTDRHDALFLSKALTIAFFPRWYLPNVRGDLKNAINTDFPLYESGQSTELPDDLQKFLDAGSPPIVFTHASWKLNTSIEEFFKASIEATRSLGERAILLTRLRFPEHPHVFATDYASLHLLLPRARAFVSHGGIGTFARAMAEGVPQIVLPTLPEQHYNGRQARKFGIGFPVNIDKYPEKAESALRSLVSNEGYREKARAMAERIPQTPDFEAAIDRMEGLIGQSVRS